MESHGETGAAVKNRYHLGRVVLDSMKSRPADDIFQIDANTDSRETVGGVLSSVVRLARALRRLGLRPGAPLALAGRNHNALRLPYYAAMLNGLPVVGLDPLFKYHEIKAISQTALPKIIFCEEEAYETYVKVAEELKLDATIFTFTGGADSSMDKLMEGVEASVEDFEPTELDTEKVYAWLVTTSGTTGVPKLAAYTHASVVKVVDDFLRQGLVSTKTGNQKIGLNFAPVEWISSYFNALMMPLINLILLQTSRLNDVAHFVELINKYKPSTVAINPSSLRSILYHEKRCDFTCFDSLTIAGERPHPDMIAELKRRVREDTVLQQAYGQTEILGPVFLSQSSKGQPFESCGTLWQDKQIKLVDPETREEITEPNKTGELLVKGPVFSEYYNNESETALAFTSDGWYRTGDLLYQDRLHHYYFVDRLKMLIKYRNFQVLPPEIEKVIITHPGVLNVAVTSVVDPEDGEHPVALVVKRPGVAVSAKEIIDLVAEKLSTANELRGGVVFVEELPMTVTGKVARSKLREVAMSAKREY